MNTNEMEFVERRGSGMILVLGDGPDQIQHVEGALVSREPSSKFPNQFLYEFQTPDGEHLTVAGCGAVNARLSEADVGKYVKLDFVGWGKAPNGPFKNVRVLVGKPRQATADTQTPGDQQPDGLPF